MEERSVLAYVQSLWHYLKSRILFWRGERSPFPSLSEWMGPEEAPVAVPVPKSPPKTPKKPKKPVKRTKIAEIPDEVPVEVSPDPRIEALPEKRPWPWHACLAILFTLIAQRAVEPPGRNLENALIIYGIAQAWTIISYYSGELVLPILAKFEQRGDAEKIRLIPLLVGIPLLAISFWMFADNQFTPLNVFLWVITFLIFLFAFWTPKWRSWIERWRSMWRFPRRVTISWMTIFAIVVIGFGLFYRLYRLGEVPPEMFSDHAEKLWDVRDLLSGDYQIFFPRNTGREAFQMYLTAAVSIIFNTGLSFMSLKIGTVLAGIFTIPYIYLLGKEIGNERVGIFAAAFAGIAYWPNVIARVALRFALYPLFAAPTLYYLVRGLRRGERKDFILSGIALGIGLHGYSPFRFVPIIVVIAVGIYLLHRQSQGLRSRTLVNFVVLVVISLIVFLPLFRYAIDNWDSFNARTLTRMGTLERDYPDDVIDIFMSNLKNALFMMQWDNGGIWVHSVSGRPALDVISASLYAIGLFLVLYRYFLKRNWVDLFLLVSIPLLLMPSVLSLAFPGENPSLNRTGGAIVPIFIMIGYSLEAIVFSFQSRLKPGWGSKVAWAIVISFFAIAAYTNYNLVFDKYYSQFRLSAWNTSELGAFISDFADSFGHKDTAYVVPYPHWVDTRLVGINAGDPNKDYALWPDQIVETQSETRAKLFLYKPEDTETGLLLEQIYPQGISWLFESKVETKEFMVYYVPPAE